MQAHSAVGAALRAAGGALRGDPIEPFRQRAEEGVSANVCEALAKLGRDDTAYEVRFGWASRQPAPPGGRRFRFDPPVINALREAAELLRRLPDGRVEVAGTVTKLSRTEGETGEVVITGEVRTERWAGEQNVRVRLTRERYAQAVQAHRIGRTVRLVGVAHRGRVVSVVQMTVADG